MHNRDRLHIMYVALDAIRQAGKPLSRTHIMWRSKLSSTQAIIYVNEMVDLGLIKPNDSLEKVKRYTITEKGWKLLQLIEQLREYFPILEKTSNSLYPKEVTLLNKRL